MGLFNWLFRRVCRKVFRSVDMDKSGRIDQVEIELCIMKLYNMVNKRLPGWQDPPSRQEIQAAMKAFDVDNNGTLDEEEFEKFARSMMKNGPDAFFTRIGKDAVRNMAIVPGSTMLAQNACRGAGGALGSVGTAPLAVLAPAVGCLFKAISGILPFGL